MLTKESAKNKLKNRLFYRYDYIKALETIIGLYDKLEEAEAKLRRLAKEKGKGSPYHRSDPCGGHAGAEPPFYKEKDDEKNK